MIEEKFASQILREKSALSLSLTCTHGPNTDKKDNWEKKRFVQFFFLVHSGPYLFA